MRHRSDIDGLRALAVIPVVLFHAGYESFAGGFIGVDVFFVVSGYLITAILLTDISRGQFSLLRFYERRVRRILPALLTVVIACAVAGWRWMTPAQYADFTGSAAATATFSSNILFYLQGGYFDLPRELKPLFHTWSLSIEEQFYLCYPLLLLLVTRFWPRRLMASIVVVATLSLALAEWSTRHDPAGSFFLLQTRGWELLAGALIATRHHWHAVRQSTAAARWLPLAGIALVVLSVAAFDQHTRHPGLLTVVPVVGSALILMFGGGADLGSRLLSTWSLVIVGLMSYSLYLWHQPIFAFGKILGTYYDTSYTPEWLIAISVVLSALTWKLVEQPFRQPGRLRTRTVWALAGVGSVAVFGFGVLGYIQDGFASRVKWPPELTASFRMEEATGNCFDVPNAHDTDGQWHCPIGTSSRPPEFFVTGDSHALAMLPAFRAVSAQTGKAGLVTGFSGCVPLIGVYPHRNDQQLQNCFLLNQRVYDFVAQAKIKTVFLVARWTYYTDGDYDGGYSVFLRRSLDADLSLGESRATFKSAFEQTIDAYSAIGVTVVVVSQVPMQRSQSQDIYRRAYEWPFDIGSRLRYHSVSTGQHTQLQSYVSSVFAARSGRFDLIDTTPVYCVGTVCPVGNATESFYVDDDHVTTPGSMMLAPRLADALTTRGR